MADRSILRRMLRAAKLDAQLYEEVEADRSANVQAGLVVVLQTLAVGVAMGGALPLATLAALVLLSLVGWLVWAAITFYIGAKLFPEPQTEADIGELLRTTGFSSAPGVLRVLGIIPGLWTPVVLICHAWMLVAMIIAVRQALDYTSTLRAVLVCLIGGVAYTVFLLLIALVGT